MLPLNPATYVFPDQSMKTKISHILHSDIEEVLKIDDICFSPAITKAELLEFTDTNNGVCKVLKIDGTIVAFHLYKIQPNSIEMIKLGVHPDHRRQGYGSKLIKEAYRKLSKKRNRLACIISEYSDESILFLKSLGFVATSVDRGVCNDGSDGYCFRLVLKEAVGV